MVGRIQLQHKWYLLWSLWLLVVVGGPAYSQNQLPDTSASTEEITLSTFLEATRVPLNREVRFHIQLSWRGALDRYEIHPIAQPVLTNLVLQGSGSSNKLEPLPEGGFRASKSLIYIFRPVELGMAYIDPMEIRYRDRTTGKEYTLQSQRVAVQIVEPVPEGKGRVKALIYVVLLLIFFSTIAFFLWRYFRLRKQRVPVEQIHQSPAEIFLKKMAQEIDPKAANLGPMSQKLSRLFREFLSQEFQLPAREASSSEIVAMLREHRLATDQLDRIDWILQEMDRIKFAGIQPGNVEFAQLYQAVEQVATQRQRLWSEQHSENQEV